MKEDEKSIEQGRKNKMKKRRIPDFRRQESWRYIRVKDNWRRARGIDSKMRKSVKGWPKSPNIGYRTDRSIRNLHPSGYREVLVFNCDDLADIKPEFEAVMISHGVGFRKRIQISIKAKELGIKILNPKETKKIAGEEIAEGTGT